MTKSERAAQIWPLLTLCAAHRQTLTYEKLGRHIGVPRHGLGQLLEPVQSYCILNDYEPLTVLVVSDVDGLPKEGFIGAEHVPSAQARVFSFDWLSITPPDAASLESAGNILPSNGRSLEELRDQKSRLAAE